MRKIKVPFVNILTILVFLPFIQACISSTQLNVIQPGLLTLPPNIDTIAIINRFVPSQNYSGNFQDNGQGFNNNYGNSVFGDLSSFNLSASDSCLGSLFYIMGYSPRFKEELIRKEMVHDGNDFFPPVLSPSVVQNVCTENHSQALVVLEGFYSNSTINTQMHSSQVPYQVPYYINGVTYYRTYYRTVYYYTATLSIFYSAGFRLYQASDGSMLDEIRIDKSMAFSRDGSSPNTAIASLPGVAFIIAKMAATISVDYAQRIAPLWKSVTRQYFTTSNKFLEQGAQFVDQKNWTEARNAWQQLYNTGKPGQKGLAAFNLALSYEMIEGDLYKARDLASESYQLLYTHNRNGEAATATSYIDTLNARINLIPKLDQQLDK